MLFLTDNSWWSVRSDVFCFNDWCMLPTVCSPSKCAHSCPLDLHMWLLEIWLTAFTTTDMLLIKPEWHDDWSVDVSNDRPVRACVKLIICIRPWSLGTSCLTGLWMWTLHTVVSLSGLLNEISTDNHIEIIVVWFCLTVHYCRLFFPSVMFECLECAWQRVCGHLYVSVCTDLWCISL